MNKVKEGQIYKTKSGRPFVDNHYIKITKVNVNTFEYAYSDAILNIFSVCTKNIEMLKFLELDKRRNSKLFKVINEM